MPDYVELEDIEELRRILIDALEEKMRDKVDIGYRIYFALKYPKTESESYDPDKDLRVLEEMRRKEKERLKE